MPLSSPSLSLKCKESDFVSVLSRVAAAAPGPCLPLQAAGVSPWIARPGWRRSRMEMGRQEGWGSSQRSIQEGVHSIATESPPSRCHHCIPMHCSSIQGLARPLGPVCQRKKRECELGWHGGAPPRVGAEGPWPPLKDAEAGDGPS